MTSNKLKHLIKLNKKKLTSLIKMDFFLNNLPKPIYYENTYLILFFWGNKPKKIK